MVDLELKLVWETFIGENPKWGGGLSTFHTFSKGTEHFPPDLEWA